MVDPLESETGADGRRNLGGYVGRDLSPREVTQAGESDGERGVQVCTGDVASGENHDHHSKSGACCISDEGFRSVVLLVHDWSRGCSKHQDEGSHELSSNLHVTALNIIITTLALLIPYIHIELAQKKSILKILKGFMRNRISTCSLIKRFECRI